jgi:hypothetical protein
MKQDLLVEIVVLGRIDAIVPPASTATVPFATLARCAPASMPRARPETTTNPASPRPRASRPAILMPAAEALRAPTMATHGFVSTEASPRTAISGGASSIAASRGG